jgi:hypothetical protein
LEAAVNRGARTLKKHVTITYVVGAFPPTQRDSSGGVPEDDAPPKILGAHVPDGIVANVVTEECNLLPERRQQEGADHVLLKVKVLVLKDEFQVTVVVLHE